MIRADNAGDITADTFEESSGMGLVIRTNPSAVRVFIDGVERGSTPITLGNLSSGEYSIRLSKEGYKDRRFNVTLFNDSRLVVSVKMEETRGLVRVSVHNAQEDLSVPFNPQVSINTPDGTLLNISLADNNETILDLPAGYNTIRVRAFGWEDAVARVLIKEDLAEAVDIYMRTAVFRIINLSQNRKRFNPLNSDSLGRTEYRIDVSAPCSAVMTVTDKNGFVVYRKQIDNFDTWIKSVTWDGRDDNGNPVPEGVYTVQIEASPLFQINEGEAEVFQMALKSEIDYSINIFPLSLTGGIAGLTFAPLAHVLPTGSYQIEAEFAFGSFSLPENAAVSSIISFPFGIGFRLSPFNRFEATVYFNVNPRVDNSTGWGISGSVKYKILNGSSFPLALAASLSYAWAGKNGEDPLSAGSGIGLYIPLSLELADFSIAFSPALFWHGPESFTPALLLSAGAIYRGSWFTAGLSARIEFDFTENSKQPKFLAGIQAHFFPPPSNIFFSIKTGIWTQNSLTGGYGGAGIGIIF